MVKMPSMDDLKKAGAGLVDSASGMVGKIKTGIESASAKKSVEIDDTVLKNQLDAVKASMVELTQLQSSQTALIRNIESQIIGLEKKIEVMQPPAASGAAGVSTTTTANTPSQNGEKKDL